MAASSCFSTLLRRAGRSPATLSFRRTLSGAKIREGRPPFGRVANLHVRSMAVVLTSLFARSLHAGSHILSTNGTCMELHSSPSARSQKRAVLHTTRRQHVMVPDTAQSASVPATGTMRLKLWTGYRSRLTSSPASTSLAGTSQHALDSLRPCASCDWNP